MKTEHLVTLVLENLLHASEYFTELGGHTGCFCFVNVFLCYIVHSSEKKTQTCYVTSCCISSLSMDISCGVKITRGALFSALKGRIFHEAGTFFFMVIDVCG